MVKSKLVSDLLSAGDFPALKDISQLLFRLYEILEPTRLKHSTELATYCVALARKMNLSEDEVRTAAFGALFHDVGHLFSFAAPKEDEKEEEERLAELEAAHPVFGERLLANISCLEPILPIVRNHHEHFDGSGFPDGLKGDEIPSLVRLVSLVHGYLIHVRGVGSTPPMPPEAARQVIQDDAGILYDGKMVEELLQLLAEMDQKETPAEAQ